MRAFRLFCRSIPLSRGCRSCTCEGGRPGWLVRSPQAGSSSLTVRSPRLQLLAAGSVLGKNDVRATPPEECDGGSAPRSEEQE
mmetsp:Transcript_14976/g.37366  ORF Transcript_14976/g.37366 Transcript_14976/m.37366 type:complete len:83 (+) Transcript_14976:748-996(+)